MKNNEIAQLTPTFYGITADDWLRMHRADPDTARQLWLEEQIRRAEQAFSIDFDPIEVYLGALCGALERTHGADSAIAQDMRAFMQFATEDMAAAPGPSMALVIDSPGRLALPTTAVASQ